jgi:hypothetical protein
MQEGQPADSSPTKNEENVAFPHKQDIYFYFILPHFNYCSEVWSTCSARNIAKLEKVNERALRFVFNEKSTSYEILLQRLNLRTLEQQRKFKILISTFNLFNTESNSENMNSFIEKTITPYRIRLKEDKIFKGSKGQDDNIMEVHDSMSLVCLSSSGRLFQSFAAV